MKFAQVALCVGATAGSIGLIRGIEKAATPGEGKVFVDLPGVHEMVTFHSGDTKYFHIPSNYHTQLSMLKYHFWAEKESNKQRASIQIKVDGIPWIFARVMDGAEGLSLDTGERTVQPNVEPIDAWRRPVTVSITWVGDVKNFTGTIKIPGFSIPDDKVPTGAVFVNNWVPSGYRGILPYYQTRRDDTPFQITTTDATYFIYSKP